MTSHISDIHSYCVFANIHYRDEDVIKGHLMVLSKEQIEAIEDIVTNGEVRVQENPAYEVENERKEDEN